MTSPLPNMYLQWTESTEPLTTFLYYVIKRREYGDTTWISVGKVPNRAVTFWNDYCVPAGITFEYIVLAAKDVTGEVVESDEDTATIVSGTVNFKSAFLHPVTYPGSYAELPHQSASIKSELNTALVRPFSRAKPTVHIGPVDSLLISVNISWPYGEQVWSTVRRVLTRQRTNGAVLCYRDGRGTRVFVGIVAHQRSDNRPQLEGNTLQLQEVEYSETILGVGTST